MVFLGSHAKEREWVVWFTNLLLVLGSSSHRGFLLYLYLELTPKKIIYIEAAPDISVAVQD